MKKFLIVLTGLVALVGGGYYLYTTLGQGGPQAAQENTTPYVVPALTKAYTNPTYNFSLKMPESFTAQEVAGEEGTTIVLQDQQSNGVQIVITPFDEDTGAGYTLTAERIKQDISDLQINDPQVLEVGQNYKGIAFKSNNDAFGGSSREVWFVFRGNLYQISTYARMDYLLKQMFSTWQFL